jgi:hypothetical protein
MASTDPSPNGSEQDVFGSLPRSRSQRRSAKRDRPGAAAPATERARRTRAARPRRAPATPATAPRDPERPGDLLTIGLRAACEVTKIGVELSLQVLRAVLGRLPRP